MGMCGDASLVFDDDVTADRTGTGMGLMSGKNVSCPFPFVVEPSLGHVICDSVLCPNTSLIISEPSDCELTLLLSMLPFCYRQ